MNKDSPETMMLDDPTVWAETAVQSASAPLRTVTVAFADLEAAVHGGVITGVQAKALWTRLTDPALAASQSSLPGQRALLPPESGRAGLSMVGLLALATSVLALSVVLVWLIRA